MDVDYSAPLPSPVPHVSLLFGPLLIGVCLNCILYGVLLLQVLIYYMSYKSDPKWIRYYVLYLFLAETTNLGCNIATIYEPLVTRFGTIGALTFFPILITATPTTNVAISTPTQIFTAWRIVVLTGKRWLGAAITAFALLSLGCAIWTATVITEVRLFSRKAETVKPAIVWFVASCIADVTITLGIYFSLTKRKTGFKSSDAIISRIIKLTLQTGLVTLFLAVAEIVLFIKYADNTTNFAIDFPLSKLYSNALLSTLNARLSWRSLGAMKADGEQEDNVLFGKPDESIRSNHSHDSAMGRRVTGLQRGGSTQDISTRGAATGIYRASYEQNNGKGETELPIAISKNTVTNASEESSIKHEV